MITTQQSTFSRHTPTPTMRKGKKQQNMGGRKRSNPNIKPPDVGEWERDYSATVDDGWGYIHGENSSACPFPEPRDHGNLCWER